MFSTITSSSLYFILMTVVLLSSILVACGLISDDPSFLFAAIAPTSQWQRFHHRHQAAQVALMPRQLQVYQPG
jgi:hypothetical protein